MWEETARIFYEAMIDSAVDKRQALITYYAVRVANRTGNLACAVFNGQSPANSVTRPEQFAEQYIRCCLAFVWAATAD